ncbi:MAG: VWA domain-containing protein [Actinomycetota bacterium]
MSFLSPAWLVALVLPLVLLVGYVVAQVQRRGYAVRLADLDLLDEVVPDKPGWRRHLPAALLTLSMIALPLGLARPAIDRSVPDERASVILAVDTSLSMAADDVDPDRIGAAKEAAATFLDGIPDAVRVGLVSFSGSAQPILSPTADHDLVLAAIEQLRLGEGTAIGEAILASLDMVDGLRTATGEDDVPATIVVLSDGETTQGTPDEVAVEEAVEADVPVSTIAFGTSRGEVTLPDGQVVPVPVNAEALRGLADAGGGVFFEALTTDELSAAFDDLGSSVGRTTEQREIGSWFLAPALVATGVAALASLRWFARLP